MRFKLFETVIVNYKGKFMPAIITNRSVKQKRRVFDIKLETGSEMPFVKVDEPNDSIYIDSEKTQKFADRIVTNLNMFNKGNVRAN